MRTVKQAVEQAQFFINDMGYTVISEPNDVGYSFMVKVNAKHGEIQLLEITKDHDKPTYILMSKEDLDIINKMIDNQKDTDKESEKIGYNEMIVKQGITYGDPCVLFQHSEGFAWTYRGHTQNIGKLSREEAIKRFESNFALDIR